MEEQNEDDLNVDMTEVKKVLEDANIFEPNMTRELMISYYRALRNSEITASEDDRTRRLNDIQEELERLFKKNLEIMEITPVQNKEIEGALERNNNENTTQDNILEEIISDLLKDASKVTFGFNEKVKTFPTHSDKDTPETYVCCSGRQTKRNIYNYEHDDDSVSNKKVKNPEEDESLKKPVQNKNSTRIQKKQETNKINSEVNKTDSEIQDTNKEKKTFMRKEAGTPVSKNMSNAEIMACSSIFNDTPKCTSEIMFEKLKEDEEKKMRDEKYMDFFIQAIEKLDEEDDDTILSEEIINEALIDDSSKEEKSFMRKETGTPVSKNMSNAEVIACSSIFNDTPKWTSEIMLEKLKEDEEKKERDEKDMELFIQALDILKDEDDGTIPSEEIINEALIDDTSKEEKSFMSEETGIPVSNNMSNAEIIARSSIFNNTPKCTSEILFEKLKEAEEKKERDEQDMELFIPALEILEGEDIDTILSEEIVNEALIDGTSKEKKTFMRKETGIPVSNNMSNAEIMAHSSIFNDTPKCTSEILFEKLKEAEEKKERDEQDMELFIPALEILEGEDIDTILSEEIVNEALIDGTSKEKKTFMRKETGIPVSNNMSNAEIMAHSSIFNDTPKWTSEMMLEKSKEAEENSESDEKNMELFLQILEILKDDNTICSEEIINEELIDGLAPLDIKVSIPTPKEEDTVVQNGPGQGKEERVSRTHLEKRPPIRSELDAADSWPSTSGTSKATIVTNNVICPISYGSIEESKIEEHAATCGDDPVSRSSSKIAGITCAICDKVVDFDTSYEVHMKECISKKRGKDQ